MVEYELQEMHTGWTQVASKDKGEGAQTRTCVHTATDRRWLCPGTSASHRTHSIHTSPAPRPMVLAATWALLPPDRMGAASGVEASAVRPPNCGNSQGPGTHRYKGRLNNGGCINNVSVFHQAFMGSSLIHALIAAQGIPMTKAPPTRMKVRPREVARYCINLSALSGGVTPTPSDHPSSPNRGPVDEGGGHTFRAYSRRIALVGPRIVHPSHQALSGHCMHVCNTRACMVAAFFEGTNPWELCAAQNNSLRTCVHVCIHVCLPPTHPPTRGVLPSHQGLPLPDVQAHTPRAHGPDVGLRGHAARAAACVCRAMKGCARTPQHSSAEYSCIT